MFKTIIIVLAMLASNAAYAGEQDQIASHGDAIAGDVVLERTVSTNDGWALTLTLREIRDRLAIEDAKWEIETFSMERSIQTVDATGDSSELLLRADSIKDGEHVMIAARLIDLRETGAGHLYLCRSGDSLVEESLEDYMDGRSETFGELLLFKAAITQVPPRPGTENLLPWENPDIPPEDQAWARQQIFGSEDALATQEGALTAGGIESTPANLSFSDSGEQSCGAGAISISLIPFSILFLLRRRRWVAPVAGLLALSLVAARADESRATIVSGYVAFWDSRQGSNLAGTRLYNDGTTNCTLNVPGCGRKGHYAVSVTISRKIGGTIVHTVVTNTNGYYVFPDYAYTPGTDYVLYLSYTRPGAPTAQMITTSSGASPSPHVVVLLPILNPSGVSMNLPTLYVNSVGDTNSPAGDIAIAWHALSSSFNYMETETEFRQRKTVGSPNTYDSIIFRYLTSGTPKCPSDYFFTPTHSRLMTMHEHAGMLLLGRVVGCDPGVGSDEVPSWPVISGGYKLATEPTSESTALSLGIRRLVTLISRFGPQSTALANVKTGTGILCSHTSANDGWDSSNSAAWPNNNALALWELIDSDTSQNDDSVSDDVDTTLNVLMTALAANSAVQGNPGDDGTEDEFGAIDTGTFCTTNASCCVPVSNCTPANVVRVCQGNAALTCWRNLNGGGDPNGGNIGDLLQYLSVAGNETNTVKSSKCMWGNPSNDYPYVGSYQDD